MSENSFRQDLMKATEIARQGFPEAQFYEADNNATRPNDWRYVYNDPATSPNSTVLVYQINGQFEAPRHIDEPFLEDRVIPLPIHLGLEQAELLARKAGYDEQITSTTLRWPLYPGVDEPSYIFAMPSIHSFVFVGVYTHKVSTSPLNT